MNNARKGVLGLAALVLVSLLPLGAIAQEDEATTTTAEIEISATSTSNTSAEDAEETQETAAASASETPGDTLPFTGLSSGHMATVAYAALLAGASLVFLTRRNHEDAKSD